jgi:hypothetical protein
MMGQFKSASRQALSCDVGHREHACIPLTSAGPAAGELRRAMKRPGRRALPVLKARRCMNSRSRMRSSCAATSSSRARSSLSKPTSPSPCPLPAAPLAAADPPSAPAPLAARPLPACLAPRTRLPWPGACLGSTTCVSKPGRLYLCAHRLLSRSALQSCPLFRAAREGMASPGGGGETVYSHPLLDEQYGTLLWVHI